MLMTPYASTSLRCLFPQPSSRLPRNLNDAKEALMYCGMVEYLFAGRNLFSVCFFFQLCLTQTLDAVPLAVTLRKVDLHANNITDLPGAASWAQMTSLRALYLHSNRIADVAAVEGLTAAPALTILTLFGNPIATQSNYRNVLVNSIPSLRVLDQYNVSDEEYIRGISFTHWGAGSRDMAFQPSNLSYPDSMDDSRPERAQSALKNKRGGGGMSDLRRMAIMPAVRGSTPHSRPRSSLGLRQSTTVEPSVDPFLTYHLMFDVLRDELERVDNMFRHRSPVVIIQRWVRGWLGRRYAKWYANARSGAATTIQAGVRRWLAKRHVGPLLLLHTMKRRYAARQLQSFVRRSLLLKRHRRILINQFIFTYAAKIIQRGYRSRRRLRRARVRNELLTSPNWFVVPTPYIDTFMVLVSQTLATMGTAAPAVKHIQLTAVPSRFEYLGRRRGRYVTIINRDADTNPNPNPTSPEGGGGGGRRVDPGTVLQLRTPARPTRLLQARIIMAGDVTTLGTLHRLRVRGDVTQTERKAWDAGFGWYDEETIETQIASPCSIVKCADDPMFIDRITRAISSAGLHEVIPCPEAIRSVAAVKIQSAYRAHRTRTRTYSSQFLFPLGIVLQLLRHHAALRVQRAYRVHRARAALRVYKVMHSVATRIGHDHFFFIKTADAILLERVCRVPPAAQPLRVLPKVALPTLDADSEWARLVLRQGIAALTHQAVPESAVGFSFTVSPIAGHTPVFLLAPARPYLVGQPPPSSGLIPDFPVKESRAPPLGPHAAPAIIRSGSVVVPLTTSEPFKVPGWFGQREHRVRLLSGFSRVSFSSSPECRRRAVLLALHTFSTRLGRSMAMLSSQDVKEHEAAAIIQAVWRGASTRAMLPSTKTRSSCRADVDKARELSAREAVARQEATAQLQRLVAQRGAVLAARASTAGTRPDASLSGLQNRMASQSARLVVLPRPLAPGDITQARKTASSDARFFTKLDTIRTNILLDEHDTTTQEEARGRVDELRATRERAADVRAARGAGAGSGAVATLTMLEKMTAPRMSPNLNAAQGSTERRTLRTAGRDAIRQMRTEHTVAYNTKRRSEAQKKPTRPFSMTVDKGTVEPTMWKSMAAKNGRTDEKAFVRSLTSLTATRVRADKKAAKEQALQDQKAKIDQLKRDRRSRRDTVRMYHETWTGLEAMRVNDEEREAVDWQRPKRVPLARVPPRTRPGSRTLTIVDSGLL